MSITILNHHQHHQGSQARHHHINHQHLNIIIIHHQLHQLASTVSFLTFNSSSVGCSVLVRHVTAAAMCLYAWREKDLIQKRSVIDRFLKIFYALIFLISPKLTLFPHQTVLKALPSMSSFFKSKVKAQEGQPEEGNLREEGATNTKVEEQLWNIFTLYSLSGNPLDPEHMTVRTFFLSFLCLPFIQPSYLRLLY